ncbi:MAG: PDDEXK nuclease domain-containing protein [Candidatus Sumerlaeia bacterium]|nr:PDDEXK nuclease domain-containing protein [Candidatus Sumerlaeia bacterium]
MNFEHLTHTISSIQQGAQYRAGLAVNQILNYRNWLIGAYIIEFEQGGEDRAEYGERLLKELSARLQAEGSKGLSWRNLYNFRLFASTYGDTKILQTVSAILRPSLGQTMSAQSNTSLTDLLHFPSLQSRKPALDWQDASWTAKLFSSLSFSHLLELARIDVPLQRAFYELECLKSGWSVRELKRQRDSMLFERVGLSKDKSAVLALATEGRLVDSPETILRDPYVLEFTGLQKQAAYSESQLEAALLLHLERFLLELGRDFCFVERQTRITVGGRHHYLDLLFYHRRLRCLVAIELKLGEFHHESAGQMNFYLNYLQENLTNEGENSPVGIILCANKDAEEVHYATAGLDRAVFVSRYLVALPSEEMLRDFLRREQELFARNVEPLS